MAGAAPIADADLRPDDVESGVTRAIAAGGARRMRALRARRASGRVVLRVEVDEVAVAETLVAAGLLMDQHTDDRGRIEAALAELIDDWASK